MTMPWRDKGLYLLIPALALAGTGCVTGCESSQRNVVADGSLRHDAAPSAKRPSPILEENQREGGSGWKLAPKTDAIESYTDRPSYLPGELARVHAAASGPMKAHWELWRIGYYSGVGGRLVASGGPVEIPTKSAPAMDKETGAVHAPWKAAFDVAIPEGAVTGAYVIKLKTSVGQSYSLLVVRDPTPHAPILYPLSVNTYQAYNTWGGNSLYVNRRGDWPEWHAYAVSFDRPYSMGNGLGRLFFYDYDFISYIEAQGYDVAYATDVDLDADPGLVSGRRMIAFQGHTEYWSARMREHVESGLAKGTSIAFFGANACYWQIRYAPAPDGRPRRVLIGYKEFAARDPFQNTEPDHVTTYWRDSPVRRPENALIGVMFGEWTWTSTPLLVGDVTAWPWVGAGAEPGALIPAIFGIEVDRRHPNGAEPPGVSEIARSPIENHQGENSIAQSTIYSAPSGAEVFAAASLTWSRALSRAGFWDRRIQVVTANVFSRFAGNGSLGSELVVPRNLPDGAPKPIYRAGVVVSTVSLRLSHPVAVSSFMNGDAAVIDGDRVVRVRRDGSLTLLAGGSPGDRDGQGTAAAFRNPRGIAVGPDDRVYVADTGNHKIKIIDVNGTARTLAGSTEGMKDATGSAAQFSTPMGIARISSGNLLVADSWNHRVRAVLPDGQVITWAGNGQRDVQDGPGREASFYFPFTIAALPDDSAVVAESDTGLVRRIGSGPDHVVTTLAGELARGGFGDGPIETAQVHDTIGVAAGPRGEVLLLDGATFRLRALDEGRIDTLAGGATARLVDGPGSIAGFGLTRAAATAPDGSIFVVDSENRALRRVVLTEQ
ncbi:MAG: hypothetical protein HY698_04435 [Deltaproteobacteria bacterium]|nr:hypothetical protein [Deltaproteobacteria bacterium]